MAPVIVPDAPATSAGSGYKSRHIAKLASIPIIGRSTLLARFQQEAVQGHPTARFQKLAAFGVTIKWVTLWLKDLIHRNVAYPTYPPGATGIFDLTKTADGPIRIAVAGDWGTGTFEADMVAENMLRAAPHYTLHIGDVYYMGEAREVSENCLGAGTEFYKGVKWPSGSRGKFSLMGNHEMYSGGHAFVSEFLPTLGLVDANKNVVSKQYGSYFCLITDHWIILGLDTGYHSGGIPPLASVPLVNRIPKLNIDARFDPKMLTWLQQTIQSLQADGNAAKPVLLLTHHQPYSVFEQSFPTPVQQLASLGFLKDRECVWLFGHEHRFTIYTRQILPGSINAYPHCIGHGGMPVDSSEPKTPNQNIQFYDPRQHPIDRDDPATLVGFNGHAVLSFDGPAMTIEYHSMEYNRNHPDRLLLTETFTPDGGGKLNRTHTLPADSPLYTGEERSE